MPIFTWDDDSGGGSVTLPAESDVRKGVKYGANDSMTGTYNIFSVNSNADTDVVSNAVTALRDFLADQIAGLTVLEEWPYGSQPLTYPSVTLFSGRAKRMPLMPEIVSYTEPDDDNKIVANEVVAEYDFSIQLDLWCRNKLERKQQLAKLLTLFNYQEVDNTGADNADGLTLILSNYFNMPVRYEVDYHETNDNEQAAERQERRQTMSILVNLREIRQRTYYAMVDIQTQVGVAMSDPTDTPVETTDLTE